MHHTPHLLRLTTLCTLALLLGACEAQMEATDLRDPDASTLEDSGVTKPDASTIPDKEDMASAPDMYVEPQPEDMNTAVDMFAGADMSTALPDMAKEVDMAPEVDMNPLLLRRSQGCNVAPGLQEGENTFMLEGLTRKYILRLPENYTHDRDWPLVFALHGNGGNVNYWDKGAKDRKLREKLKDNAILIVAEAIDGKWRDYDGPVSERAPRLEKELRYFDKIIKDAKSSLCVNTDAIFSMGFSGGGSYSGVLGCRRTNIRAIAVGGSVIYFDKKNCVGTPAAWITIGAGEQAQGRTDYKNYFRERAGCTSDTEATAPAPCVAYQSCNAETPVHYCEHAKGHVWPAIGVDAAWDFFSRFVE